MKWLSFAHARQISLSAEVGSHSNGKYVFEYPTLPVKSATTCLYLCANKKTMSGNVVHFSLGAEPSPPVIGVSAFIM
jgi:hypothetical protein